MNIEKTYKLYIKDNSYELTEEEVNELYNACRKALNISLTTTPTFPYYPPGVREYPITYPWATISTTGTPSFPDPRTAVIAKNDNDVDPLNVSTNNDIQKSIRIRNSSITNNQ